MNRVKLILCNSRFAIVFFILYTATNARAQVFTGMGIGTSSPHSSAVLDVYSNSKGMLIPRLNTSQRLSIPSPAQGLLVFDTDFAQFWYFDGLSWLPIGNATSAGIKSCPGVPSGYIPVYLQSDSLCSSMIFQAVNRVGIGLTNPASQLHVAKDLRVGNIIDTASGNSGFPGFGYRLYFSGGPDGATYDSENSDPLWLARYNAGEDRTELRLNLSDNCNSGADAFIIQSGGAGCASNTVWFSFNDQGLAFKPGGGAWSTLSDARLKEHVEYYDKGLEMLKNIHPVTYRYNGKGGTPQTGKYYTGVIAQQLQHIAPEMVTATADGWLSVDPSDFTYMLINAVQELDARVSMLEAENRQLKELINEMSTHSDLTHSTDSGE